MVSVDLVKVPSYHLLSYRNVERLESVLHQLSKFLDVNQLVFSLLRWLPGFLSSFPEEVRKLNKPMFYIFIEGDFSVTIFVNPLEMPVELILRDVVFGDP